MSTYTVHYHPLAYGDITPAAECKHDPAGHRIDLGIRIDRVGRKRKINRDGWFCMKCGTGTHVEADSYIDLWWIAKRELSGKCMEFDVRMMQLAEDRYGDFHDFMQATVMQDAERQAAMIGWASR